MMTMMMVVVVCTTVVVNSHPTYVKCDLSSNVSASDNVMTKATIMGLAPDDRSDLMTVSSSDLTTVTFTLSSLLPGGLVVRSSNGQFELPTDTDFKRHSPSCNNGADLIYMDETGAGNRTVPQTLTLVWRNNSIGETSTDFGILSGNNNVVAVRRQSMSIPASSNEPGASSSKSSDNTKKIILIVGLVTAFLLVVIGWLVYHFKFHGKMTDAAGKEFIHGEPVTKKVSKREVFHPIDHAERHEEQSKHFSKPGRDTENVAPL